MQIQQCFSHCKVQNHVDLYRRAHWYSKFQHVPTKIGNQSMSEPKNAWRKIKYAGMLSETLNLMSHRGFELYSNIINTVFSHSLRAQMCLLLTTTNPPISLISVVHTVGLIHSHALTLNDPTQSPPPHSICEALGSCQVKWALFFFFLLRQSKLNVNNKRKECSTGSENM